MTEGLSDRLRTLAFVVDHVFGGDRRQQAIADLWESARIIDEISGNPRTRREKPGQKKGRDGESRHGR